MEADEYWEEICDNYTAAARDGPSFKHWHLSPTVASLLLASFLVRFFLSSLPRKRQAQHRAPRRGQVPLVYKKLAVMAAGIRHPEGERITFSWLPRDFNGRPMGARAYCRRVSHCCL